MIIRMSSALRKLVTKLEMDAHTANVFSWGASSTLFHFCF